MQIVGEVEVKEIIEDSPQKVWKRTASAAGIDKAFFDEYYSGKKNAIAYALGKVIQYSKPQLLSDYGIKSAPQSFMYIDSSKLLQQIWDADAEAYYAAFSVESSRLTFD